MNARDINDRAVAPARFDDRPCIVVEGNGDLADAVDALEAALIKTQAPIYQRGGMLVRVVAGEAARVGVRRDPAAPRIVPLDDVALQDLATRYVATARRNRKTQKLDDVDVPRDLARALLARREWAFPTLEAVVEHPVLLPDGRVLWEPGYDAGTGLLLQAPPAAFQAPLDKPTRSEALRALSELRALLQEFPFTSETDEAVALAYLLTWYVRPVLETAPAFAMNATGPGSGKTTLVQLGSITATGRQPALLTLTDDPAEMRKLLLAALLEGDASIAIDNVDTPVDSADLCVVLTSPMYRGRVLGASLTAAVPTKAIVTLNGNSLTIVGDLTRRVLECRLDPACERPAEREFAGDPIAAARELRSELVLAALTIMQAYASSGKRVAAAPFGSFATWSRMVREALLWLGCADPCASLRHLEAEDPERALLRTMLEVVGDLPLASLFTVSALLAIGGSRRQSDLADDITVTPAQRQALAEALRAGFERNGELSANALGRWLRRVAGRVVGHRRFVRAGERDHVALWRVERVDQ